MCCQYVTCPRTKVGHYKFHLWRRYRNLIDSVNSFIYKLNDFNYKHIDDIEVEGINSRDYPDFCDAFIVSATYKGKPMSETQLDRLNENKDFVYEQVVNKLY